jgi:hypothetical protein
MRKNKKNSQQFDRVRLIQEEMIRLAVESEWLLIEQKLEPDPLEMVASRLWQKCKTNSMGHNATKNNVVLDRTNTSEEKKEERDTPKDDDATKPGLLDAARKA